MSEILDLRPSWPLLTEFSRVATCKIHPGIGVARVGNSPDQFFIGPEIPKATAPPSGGYKDPQGRVKRQAARFRIYAYDAEGNVLGEVPIDTTKASANDQRQSEAQTAHVVWTVHLANKKGAWYKFIPRGDEHRDLRNPTVQPEAPPDERDQLIIDPGPRSISGAGEAVDGTSTLFDTGEFRGTKVPLGEIRTDSQGRLLVLGGLGKSASIKSGNPIGANSTRGDYWADNDDWYDDISDGVVSATVTLAGKTITIDSPEGMAWVVVAPPKFAPGVYPIVTLYDVIRAVEVKRRPGNNIGRLDDHVEYFCDIYPVLMRAADTSWVNNDSRRGHGYGKKGDFGTSWRNGASQPTSDDARRIFAKLRTPKELADADTRKRQASPNFMPQLSGDLGDMDVGDPDTWLSLLPWQYQKFQKWKDGAFTPGQMESFSPADMPPADQVTALQRAALEPCIGGPFFPGIEMTYFAADATWYADAFRIDGEKFHPGDVTKNMALPWQADFSDCKNGWWPAQRPDDVVPQDAFDEANNRWEARLDDKGKTDQDWAPVEEDLLDRVDWARGLGVTSLFRWPWHNPLPNPPMPDGPQPATPASFAEDPRDSSMRSCDDMVRYWHELGFVTPVVTKSAELIHVELERRPYAGMDVRALFHALLNMDRHLDALPKCREYVEGILAAAREVQHGPQAFAVVDNIRPFQYSEAAFVERMNDIYDDTANNFADPRIYSPNPQAPANAELWFTSLERVIERIRQLIPFNLLDGSWLRNIHQLGPVDEVNATLFSILKEELGDGVVSQNHANIYRDLCHSVGIYPPPIASLAFARDPLFLDAAFESPAFQLAISQFTRDYYPELIGMTLYLEWTVLTLHRAERLLAYYGLDTQFYRMHIGIDNAASGHGSRIMRAVQLYVQTVRDEGSNVQCEWQRIWDGYVGFGYTFSALISQIKYLVSRPPSTVDKVIAMIARKRPYGQFNHGMKTLAGKEINSLFHDPQNLMQALVAGNMIVPGKPEASPFFDLLAFQRGPMYHVFTDEEIDLWRQWTIEGALSEEPVAATPAATPASPEAAAVSEAAQPEGQSREQPSPFHGRGRSPPGVSENRLQQWRRIARAQDAPDAGVVAPQARRAKKSAYVDGSAKRTEIMETRLNNWLGWSMVRVLTHLARQQCEAVPLRNSAISIADPRSGKQRTVAAWLDAIRHATNPAIVARSFLASLAAGNAAGQAFVKEARQPTSVLGHAFQTVVPGNDGHKAIETLEAWLAQDAPLPQVRRGRVKPLSLDSTLDEEEHHPFGVALGFGRIS